jgi:hypothetical protein
MGRCVRRQRGGAQSRRDSILRRGVALMSSGQLIEVAWQAGKRPGDLSGAALVHHLLRKIDHILLRKIDHIVAKMSEVARRILGRCRRSSLKRRGGSRGLAGPFLCPDVLAGRADEGSVSRLGRSPTA